ncbi:hypothetical protein FAZ21_16815 [Chitiniphilus eburneus]|uniref:Uncharacterized protein n=2 Tax=Chitiniphilus eburneus TaxID=2571148 RepID=A0A4U0PG93_9NEIS|nr:hypothetical protein FAZ21_16815 [Chitiniphilus eburneus]
MEETKEFISDGYLDEVERRCNAAAPMPWVSYVEGRDHQSGSNFIMIGEGENRREDIELIGASVADQDFIAKARQDIPQLIEAIRFLKKSISGVD